MEQKVPVFKSDDIKNTMSKEQVDHFVNVKKSPKIISLASKEKIKRSRVKILIAVASALVLISLIIFLPALFKNLSVKSEADNLAERTEGYLNFLETEEQRTPSAPTEDGEPEENPEYKDGNFDTFYNEITEYLNSDKSYHNDEKNLELSNSLMALSRKFNSLTIYSDTIETLKIVYSRLDNNSSKAELNMLLAEAYYVCDQEVEAFEHYSKAVELDPKVGDLTYYDSMSSSFMDMLIYCQGRAAE